MNLPTRGSVAFFVALIRKKHSPSHHIRAAAKAPDRPRRSHLRFPAARSLLEDMNMTFFKDLDTIMKQDFGNRGLLKALPDNPIRETLETLSTARRVILLTGFPVRLEDGTYVGETDGPLGIADIAAALTALGVSVLVITDEPAFSIVSDVVCYRAPKAKLMMLPKTDTEDFIRSCIKNFSPTHFISLERPGKAANGHYHSMRGEVLDDMITDSALFLSEAKKAGAVTISIGDGGNEMGMGTYRNVIETFVPFGDKICTAEAADLTLASGVSNWWGIGIAALCSLLAEKSLLPTRAEETESLRLAVAAGSVDGCTRKNEMTVDHLDLETHLGILDSVDEILKKELGLCAIA